MENQNPIEATTSTKDVPQKASTRFIWTVFISGIVILGFVFANALSCVGPKPVAQQNQQSGEAPTTMGPDGAKNFALQQNSEAAYLKRKAQQEANERALDGANHTMGAGRMTPDEYAQATGQSPNMADPTQEAPGTPAMTEDQKRALRGDNRTPQQQRSDDIRAERKRKRQAALDSSAVAVDFSGYFAKKDAAPQQKQAEAAQEQQPRAAAVSDRDETIPEKKTKYDFDAADGPTYRIFEGTILEAVLTNRINGALAGPINVMITTDVYSNNHQKLLIPQGTRVLGNVVSVKGTTDERLAVAFHRAICPDGYSIDLDQFKGLNVVGETGLRDKVNHHYLQIFGASAALAAIQAIGQAATSIGYAANGGSNNTAVIIGPEMGQSMSQSVMPIFSRFMNILPTFILRERTRVKVYLSNDVLVPAYASHRMDPNL